MDKQLHITLNAKRTVSGTLRGYDAFMNIVLDEAVEVLPASQSLPQGARQPLGMVVLRGNCIVSMQVLG